MGAGARNMRAPGGLGRLEKILGDLPLDPGLPKRVTDGAMGMPGQLQITRSNLGQYTVGAHCSPVGPALRHHLNLGNGVGLIVDAVTGDSPAVKAGIQQYDILLYANQSDLSSVEDLVKAVDKAGDEGLPLSLNLLRKGEEVGVEVEPIKRTAPEAGASLGLNGVQWNQIGPGIIIGGEDGLEGFEQQMKQMEEQMRKMHEQMKTLQDQALGGRLDNSDR